MVHSLSLLICLRSLLIHRTVVCLLSLLIYFCILLMCFFSLLLNALSLLTYSLGQPGCRCLPANNFCIPAQKFSLSG